MKYNIGCFFCLSIMFLLETRAFAVKKKRNNKQVSSRSKKGFGGGVAPTLEETLQSFPSRIPKHISTTTCPCGSGLVYGDCCGPIHSGTLPPPPSSPMAVLRARYTAFCLRNIGYTMSSTHVSCRDYQEDKIEWAKSLHKNGMFDSFEFIQLVVISEQVPAIENNDEAFVEFQVTLKSRESGEETQVAERSRFVCQDGQWLYAGGDVHSLEKGVHDIILNP